MVIDEIHGNEEDDMDYVEINNRKRGRSMDNYPDVDDDVNNDSDDLANDGDDKNEDKSTQKCLLFTKK